MSHHDKAIADAETKLVTLIAEAKGTPGLFARVKLWTQRMCVGRKLSEFLHDESIDGKNRVTVAKSLVDILLSRDFDRLPKVDEDASSRASLGSAVMGPQAPGKVDEDTAPVLPPEFQAMVRREVRLQLAITLETIAKVLRETA